MTSWILSILIAVIPFFYSSQYTYNSIHLLCMWDIMGPHGPIFYKYVNAIFMPTFLISNTILGFTSLANIIKLKKLQTRALRGSKSDNLSRASNTALIVVLAFTICYLPRYLMVFFKHAPINRFWVYYRTFGEALIYFNSAINPLIYIFRSKQFMMEIASLMNVTMGYQRPYRDLDNSHPLMKGCKSCLKNHSHVSEGCSHTLTAV